MIEQYEHNGHTIEIHHDDDPTNPRDYANIGHFIFWHNRYKLGDKHEFTPEEFHAFKEENPNNIYLPVYMYEHSGITISTSPFSCSWDSGQIGWAYAKAEDVHNEFNGDFNKATSSLQLEIEEYDDFISGNFYGYRVMDGEKLIESSWGFNGIETCKSQAQEVSLCARYPHVGFVPIL